MSAAFRWVRYGSGQYKSLLGSIMKDGKKEWAWTPPSHIGGISRVGYRTLVEAQADAEREMSHWMWPDA